MSTTIDVRSRVQDGRIALWAAASTIVVLFFAVTRPLTHWEMDEILFRLGVERFEPLLHHPHPPGYPLLVGLGKLAALLTGDPFQGLVLLAIVSMAVSFPAFGAAVARLTGHAWTGLAASTLFHLSPAMMVHGPMPMSDPPALMFASLALLSASSPAAGVLPAIGTGLFAAASIGCRPQYALAILPFLAWVIIRDRRRDRTVALLAAFTAVCLAWLVPLVQSTGGLAGMVAWQRGQASWVAQHDADLARRAQSLPALALRFVAHPWGSKLTSGPVLLLAAAGLGAALAGRLTGLLPVAVLSLAHLVSAVALNDPADGVRYALPAQYLTAALAAVGLTAIATRIRRPAVAAIAVGLFVGASWLYVRPVVSLRSTEPSPPVRAAAWARLHLGRDARILYDRSLHPHAQVLLGGLRAASSDAGVPAVAGSTWLFGEGVNPWAHARVFSWPDSDAYGKLTRNHYRVVSLTRLEAPPLHLQGVGPWESAAGGLRWRWLSDAALIGLPAGDRTATLVLGLPADAPHETTRVRVFAGDRLTRTATVHRDRLTTLELALPPDRLDLRIASDPFYTIPGDSRRFGVQLFHLDRGRPKTTPPSTMRSSVVSPRTPAAPRDVADEVTATTASLPG